MVDVLVIPDGAAQPVRSGQPTALETARTPVLNRLCAEGAVRRVASTPPGLRPGSEVGIPTLLGCAPVAQIGRGHVEAAAHGVDVPAGVLPWRADVTHADGRRASSQEADDVVTALGPSAQPLGGHRLLLLSASRPADRRVLGLCVRVWADGPPPAGSLSAPTTIVCARGAAAGCGRLLGAAILIPAGATGDVDTDLRAKTRAAVTAITGGVARVVVHLGAPDEAAHRRDQDSVRGALERVDLELLGPLSEAVRRAGGRLAVCPDHGTDPVSGEHTAAPVPAVLWGEGISASGPAFMHERLASHLGVADPDWLMRGSPPVAA